MPAPNPTPPPEPGVRPSPAAPPPVPPAAPQKLTEGQQRIARLKEEREKEQREAQERADEDRREQERLAKEKAAAEADKKKRAAGNGEKFVSLTQVMHAGYAYAATIAQKAKAIEAHTRDLEGAVISARGVNDQDPVRATGMLTRARDAFAKAIQACGKDCGEDIEAIRARNEAEEKARRAERSAAVPGRSITES